MKRAIRYFVLAITCVLSTGVAMSGEDRNFEEERLRLCKNLQELLVQKNQCSGGQDCTARQLLFCSPARGGLNFQLWGVQHSDVHAEAIAIIGREFAQQRGKVNFKFVAYAVDKKTSLAGSFWKKDDVILEVDFQGGE